MLKTVRTCARLIAVLSLAAIVSACAKSPDAIEPVSMGNAFVGLDCATASRELQISRQRLAALESQQRSAVAGDAVGVLFIGVPMSSLTGGDKAGVIAAEKGKILALDSRLVSCRASG